MIDIGTIASGSGLFAAVASVVVVLVKTRGATSTTTANLKQQNDEYIDKRVEAQLRTRDERIDLLEERVATLTEDRDFQKSAVRTLGDGFDALSDYVERTAMNPEFTRREKQLIDDAKALLADDSLWNTSARFPSPKDSTTT